MGWTPELISLFAELKVGITSSPVLARFDPEKPTFLKTDWSAEGMGWILMQPADDKESTKAMQLLKRTGECQFDLSMNGARLKPVFFGSRSCNDMEKKYHSFTGEGACGRQPSSCGCCLKLFFRVIESSLNGSMARICLAPSPDGKQ